MNIFFINSIVIFLTFFVSEMSFAGGGRDSGQAGNKNSGGADRDRQGSSNSGSSTKNSNSNSNNNSKNTTNNSSGSTKNTNAHSNNNSNNNKNTMGGSGGNNDSYKNTGNNPGNSKAPGYNAGVSTKNTNTQSNNNSNNNKNTMGGSGGNNNSYKNTGNNPGNAKAPGYNAGGSTKNTNTLSNNNKNNMGGSGGNNNNYKNTGNNPGNAKAPGYNIGSKAPKGGSGSSATKNSYANTGNNPGNAKAPGYSIGSNAPKGGSGLSSTKNNYTNTGNNPGNAKAPGYNIGSNAPKGGSGSSATKNSYANTGNNPGNDKAPGYSRAPASSSGRGNSSSAFGGVANTIKSVGQSAVTAAKNFYGETSPHVRAAVAGQRALEASIRGTTGLGSAAAQRSMERAMYKGRAEQYALEGIDIYQDSFRLSLGPVEEHFRKNPKSSMSDYKYEIQTVDYYFREAGAYVSLPGEITEANGRQVFGANYNKFSALQKFGLQNSVIAVAREAVAYEGLAADLCGKEGGSCAVRGAPLVVFASNVEELVDLRGLKRTLKPSLEGTFIHELDHAGGFRLAELVSEKAKNTDSVEDRKRLSKDLRILASGTDGRTNSNLEKLLPANLDKEIVDYITRPTEVLAFGTTQEGRNLLAQQILRAQKKLTDSIKPNLDDFAEARRIADTLIDSPSLKLIREKQEYYAKQSLK